MGYPSRVVASHSVGLISPMLRFLFLGHLFKAPFVIHHTSTSPLLFTFLEFVPSLLLSISPFLHIYHFQCFHKGHLLYGIVAVLLLCWSYLPNGVGWAVCLLSVKGGPQTSSSLFSSCKLPASIVWSRKMSGLPNPHCACSRPVFLMLLACSWPLVLAE